MRPLAAMLLLALAACNSLPQYEATRTAVVATAAKAEDQALADAEFVMCRGISVGAWVRHYSASPALAQAWRAICGTPIPEMPAGKP